jgi:NADH dehydrogenase
MNRYLRRILTGLFAGLAGGAALAATLDHDVAALPLGVAAAIGYSVSVRYTPGAASDHVMTAASLSTALWLAFSVILFPLFSGRAPQWTAAGMLETFPQLVGWVLYGAVFGLALQGIQRVFTAAFGQEPEPEQPANVTVRHIVILGGGFAGMATAENLEREFGGDRSVAFTLVSETNALLFTPMLAEVAGSSLEPTHISSPLRTSLRRTQVVRGKARAIDLDSRRVTVETGGTERGLVYDQLILALGSVSNYHGMEQIERVSYDFKTLIDAIRIRNRVIDMFESADREPDTVRRRELLTFVVAGGGFAGVELAGALNDFARGMLADYPNLGPDDVSVILVHSRDRILPELSAPLAAYALERMSARGVIFRLNARLADARPGVVVLKPEEELRAATLVWTAGTAPNPLLKTLAVERDKRGAAIVNSTLSVPGRPGVWALGDCAVLTDARTGQPCPPTAQFALREARTLARNIHAALNGRPQAPFHFSSLGALCVVGHQTACAEIALPFAPDKKVRFSGLLAWLMWRSIYLSKLPGRERKVRVMVDWIIELFFPRDIVQTIDFSDSDVSGAAAPEPRAARVASGV